MAPFDELVERAEGTAAETRRLVAVLQQTPLVAGTESLKSLVGDVLAKIAADEAASMSVQTEKQKLLKQEANLEQYELSIKQYQAKLEREEARLKDEEAKLDAKRKLDKVQTEKFSRQEKELRSKETEFEQQRKITEDLTAIMQELKLATESAKDLRPQLRELKGLTKDLATASTTTKEDHSDVTNAAQKLQDLLGANEALKAQLQEERDALRQGQQAVSDRQNELSRSEAELQRKQDAAKDTLEAHENFEAVKEALIKQHKAETDELKRRLLKFQNKRQELLDNLADRDRLLEEEKVAVATSQAELCNDFRVAAQLEANLNNSMTRAAETLRDLQKEGRQTAKYLTDRCNHLTDASNEIAPYLENIKKEYGAFKADFDRDDLKASVAAITEECSSIKGYLRKAREESDGVLAELISLEDRISDTQPFEVSDEEDVTMSQEPTDTSIGKRPYRPSSSDPSPRKEPSSKRARAEPGLSPILSRQASPEHQRHRQPSRPQVTPPPPSRSPPPPPPTQPTRSGPPGSGTNRFSSIPVFRTRRPPPPSQSSSPGRGSATQSSGPGRQSATQLEEAQQLFAGPSSAEPDIPQAIRGIWSQMILDDDIGRVERTRLRDWLAAADKKTKTAARPLHHLSECANMTTVAAAQCLTSRLRGRPGGQFHTAGTNDVACKQCERRFPCFRVSWVNDQAKTDTSASKRWKLEQRAPQL